MRGAAVVLALLLGSVAQASPPVTGSLVHGRVLAEDGLPVGGARVQVFEPGGHREVWTGPDGRFGTWTQAAGPFHLNVSAPYHGTRNESLVASAGGALQHDIRLERTGYLLSGNVTHHRGGVPLSGAVVEVAMSHGSGCEPGTPCGDREAAGPQELRPEFRGRNLTTMVQEDGRYALALGSGWAGVRITMDGFVPSGGGFVVFGNQTVNEQLRPLPVSNAVVHGTVFDAEGRPAEGAHVKLVVVCLWVGDEASPPPSCDVAAEGTTGSDGTFRFQVPRNYYELQATRGARSARDLVDVDDNETAVRDLHLSAAPRPPPGDAPVAKAERGALPPEENLLGPKPGASPEPRPTPLPSWAWVAAAAGLLAVLARRR